MVVVTECKKLKTEIKEKVKLCVAGDQRKDEKR